MTPQWREEDGNSLRSRCGKGDAQGTESKKLHHREKRRKERRDDWGLAGWGCLVMVGTRPDDFPQWTEDGEEPEAVVLRTGMGAAYFIDDTRARFLYLTGGDTRILKASGFLHSGRS
ncbi:hypothetical protein MAPG_07252 [Magnaporthiopsis poae ATCC 64411]|uniref:Uncharacterized protein n=1 Tax=Magnaporthiopsis poae (strain ATCC 64411 / 73-15) TaxID=644358 RepID=A0A0C4E463_MAGP6|nr:hypothetical protein MAPG_07252 [Magnaporthiopsis poae ATCC 64411]